MISPGDAGEIGLFMPTWVLAFLLSSPGFANPARRIPSIRLYALSPSIHHLVPGLSTWPFFFYNYPPRFDPDVPFHSPSISFSEKYPSRHSIPP